MSNKKLNTVDDKFKTILKQSPSSKKRAMRNSKALNRSFIEKQIIKNEPDLNEAALQIKKFELERTSTPNSINICEHCDHNHARVSFSCILKIN